MNAGRNPKPSANRSHGGEPSASECPDVIVHAHVGGGEPHMRRGVRRSNTTESRERKMESAVERLVHQRCLCEALTVERAFSHAWVATSSACYLAGAGLRSPALPVARGRLARPTSTTKQRLALDAYRVFTLGDLLDPRCRRRLGASLPVFEQSTTGRIWRVPRASRRFRSRGYDDTRCCLLVVRGECRWAEASRGSGVESAVADDFQG